MGVTLFAVASEGRARHWDESAPPHAVLLRWMLDEELGPALHGFQVSTSEVALTTFSDFGAAKGRTVHSLGLLTIASVQGMMVSGPTLFIPDGQEVFITLAEPAGAVTITAGVHQVAGLRVAVSRHGRHPIERALAPQTSTTFTARAIDTIRLRGPGSLAQVAVALADGPYRWTTIATPHLPVAHPNHPARSVGDFAADADLARSRLPPGIWNAPPLGFRADLADRADPASYEQVFAQIHPVLLELFEGASDNFPPNTGQPRLELARWQAIELACLDPYVARMLGFACDHVPADFPSDRLRAYRVVGGWERKPQGGLGGPQESIVPALLLREPDAPAAPTSLEARVTQPSRLPRVSLRWEIPKAQVDFAPIIRYQPFARHINSSGAPVPVPPAPTVEDQLLASPLLVPQHVLENPLPYPFVEQRHIADGFWAWWVRSVDVFGRTGQRDATQAVVADRAAPPPPHLVDASWIQAGLAMHGSASPGATRFRANHPNEDALVVRWAWTPELHLRAPDVAEFRVLVRRPGQTTDGGIDWHGASWEPAIHTELPDRVVVDVQVQRIVNQVTVFIDRVVAIDRTTFVLEVDLSLEDGADRLAGARLQQGGGMEAQLVSVAYAQPTRFRVTIASPSASAPVLGPATLSGRGLISAVVEPIAPVADPSASRAGGLLAIGDALLARLGRSADGRVVAASLEGVAVSGPGRWYGAWEVVIRDSGFAPRTAPGLPVAQLEVGVVAVRPPDLFGGERISDPAGPHTVRVVDTSRPLAPTLDPLPDGKRCSQIATAADFHGSSFVELRWSAEAHIRYRVYRAAWASVVRADRDADKSGLRQEVPDHDLPTDPDRREAAREQLDNLSTALSSGQEVRIAAAYEALLIDARAALASQAHVVPAYTALDEEPVDASAQPYEDSFDGRAAGQWVYRIEPVSAAGVPGDWSPATPPICAPDVVAPRAPQVQQALARPGAVRLLWLKSAAADIDHYVLYRSQDPQLSDVRDLEQIALLARGPDAPVVAGQQVPESSAAHEAWLEFDVDVEPGQLWHYRLTAVDSSGNMSAPSKPLRCAALAEPPAAPIWTPPVRNPDGTVTLTWSADDDRLVCLVERRPVEGGRWAAAGGWLPRGRYDTVDRPPGGGRGWEYRLRVANVAGLPAADRPVVVLAEAN